MAHTRGWRDQLRKHHLPHWKWHPLCPGFNLSKQKCNEADVFQIILILSQLDKKDNMERNRSDLITTCLFTNNHMQITYQQPLTATKHKTKYTYVQYQLQEIKLDNKVMFYHDTNIRLTHWGRVMHICISNLTIIGSDNGLSPGRRQAIIWTNDVILWIRPLGTNFSEILIEFLTFDSRKCVWMCRLQNGDHFVSASMC